MLPLINTNPNSNDGNMPKQLSVLRNQMAQLRDAIEADLANIRYDNLSSDLQKRIDGIDHIATSAAETADMVAQSLVVNYATINDLTAQTARINTIEASYIKASEVSANYATITSLNAQAARIDTISANYVTADYVSANYASYGWVEALNAIVGRIDADYVTAGQLSAVTIDASQITSGRISSSRIDVTNLMANTSDTSWANINVAKLNYIIDGNGDGGSRTFWKYNSSMAAYCLCCMSVDA